MAMLAIHARYRGREVRRAQLVRRSAEAMSTNDGVGEFEILGVEDICAVVDSRVPVRHRHGTALRRQLGHRPGTPGHHRRDEARATATGALTGSARAGVVKVAYAPRRNAPIAGDIAAAFALLGHVLGKRTSRPGGHVAGALGSESE